MPATIFEPELYPSTKKQMLSNGCCFLRRASNQLGPDEAFVPFPVRRDFYSNETIEKADGT